MIRKSSQTHFALISWIFFVIFFLSVLFAAVSFFTLRNYAVQKQIEDLFYGAQILKNAVSQELLNGEYDLLREKVKSLTDGLPYRVTVIKLDGEVISDSYEDYRKMENHRNREEITLSENSRFGKVIRYSTTVKDNLIYLAVRIGDEKIRTGFIRLSIPVLKVSKSVYDIMKYVVLIDIVLLITAVFVSNKILSRFTSPLEDISAASRKVASGDFSIRLHSIGDNEIVELIRNFNNMTKKLDELFHQVNSEKEQAKSILSSVSEGIILISQEGIVKEANRSFIKLSGNNENIINRFYWEVIRNNDLIKLIKKSGRHNAAEEIYYGGKNFICSCNFITATNEKILIISDITKIKNLESLKKDFVANVSHELRTPLTAIKGFIETLIEFKDEEDDEYKYLNIIARHTERMIHIVNDLLILSEVEQKEAVINIEEVNLLSLSQTMKKFFADKLNNKSLEFDIQSEGSVTADADPYRIEQLFINLIDNAIKYTDRGRVSVNLERKGDYVKIDFADTGIGINLSQIDNERLFERFFVVDKSRSRKTGGTGLGLSIVKHIVLLHNGEISIKSIPGVGTTITVLLPVKHEKPELTAEITEKI